MLTIRINGLTYKNFISARVINDISTIAGAFSFEATTGKSVFPIRLGDSIEILADDIIVLNGFVEELNLSYDFESHNVVFSGRTKLCDLIDSTVPYGREFNGGVSLVTIAELLLSDIGYTDVEVINNVSDLQIFKEEEIISAEQDQTCADFLLSFARKRQVYINSDVNGNLVITRGSTGTAPTSLQNIIESNSNNIKRSNYTINTYNRFNEYRCISNLNPSSLLSIVTPQEVSNQEYTVNDTEMRSTRRMTFIAEESSDISTCKERATWESNIRRANSLTYNVVVQGHTFNNQIWEMGKEVQVNDDFAGINANMLIKSVEMNYSVESGSETLISCTNLDAYTLALEEPDEDKKTNEKNNILKDYF